MDFQDYLVPGKTGLLIGIGGVSMSPLAEVLHDAGLDIRGSDMSESDNTLTLRERGIPIHIGHSAANVTDDIEFVIRTPPFMTTIRRCTRRTAAASGL